MEGGENAGRMAFEQRDIPALAVPPTISIPSSYCVHPHMLSTLHSHPVSFLVQSPRFRTSDLKRVYTLTATYVTLSSSRSTASSVSPRDGILLHRVVVGSDQPEGGAFGSAPTRRNRVERGQVAAWVLVVSFTFL